MAGHFVGSMIQFHLLPSSKIPWDILDRFEDRVVFQSREWLEFIAESHHATPVVAEIHEGSTLIGYFSGLVVRKIGARILGSSFPGWTTPYIGFNVRAGYSRSALLAPLAAWVFTSSVVCTSKSPISGSVPRTAVKPA